MRLHILQKFRKPQRRRGCRDAGKTVGLICTPQGKQPCHRVPADDVSSVCVLTQRQDFAEQCRSTVSEVLMTENRRCAPRRQVVVPAFNLDGNQTERLCSQPLDLSDFVLDGRQVVVPNRLQQHVFRIWLAVFVNPHAIPFFYAFSALILPQNAPNRQICSD